MTTTTTVAATGGALLGGLGLFLLGMWLMTDGLRLAGGSALEHILGRWTRSRPRALLSGMLITALVQSSSAVTVAAIGFVNAGVLTFGQAMWVIFGSNVGTTMTGWLVALIGFSLKIEALALPLLGAGMVLRLTGSQARRAAIGTALAGFGALFMGIDVLRDAFSGLGSGLDVERFAGGEFETVAYVLAGILLTTVMQSSSAALAIALTAASGDLISLAAAAAMVIGANIGTTITALLAAVGATPNAKRAAAAHVVFNILTGIVALLLLPVMLRAVEWLRTALEMEAAPAATLALFHSSFNVLGVMLMWPLSRHLERGLEARFRTAEEDASRPRYLDDTVLAVSSLAIDALIQEVKRTGNLAIAMVSAATTGDPGGTLAARKKAVDRLAVAAAEFAVRLNRASMPPESAERLPRLLRVSRYYDAVAELAADVGRLYAETLRLSPGPLRDRISGFGAAVRDLLARLDPGAQCHGSLEHDSELARFQQDYQSLKATILEAGAQGTIPIQQMDTTLQMASRMRRCVEQAAKAAHALQALEAGNHRTGADSEGGNPMADHD